MHHASVTGDGDMARNRFCMLDLLDIFIYNLQHRYVQMYIFRKALNKDALQSASQKMFQIFRFPSITSKSVKIKPYKHDSHLCQAQINLKCLLSK